MAIDKNKCDGVLGKKVNQYLREQKVETPLSSNTNVPSDENKIEMIEGHVQSIMDILGLDLSDDSLRDTPSRVAKMYVNEVFYGLETDNFPKITVVDNKFQYDEMVLEKGINVMSHCEHHFVSIIGKATVAYIPGDKVIGLSKMNRVVDYFARRPQVQERLTAQIFHTLRYVLGTDDVAVLIDADHHCVKCRGVGDTGSSTVTSKIGGVFKTEAATRAEFMSLARR